jgi:NAD+ synthase/NAD+ synthase (glutamine-hydrolysing)
MPEVALKVAMLQLNPLVGDIEGNALKVKAGMAQAASMGASLCLTPELFLVGYPPRDLLLYPSFIAKAEQALAFLARESAAMGMSLVVGTVGANQTGSGMPLRNEAVYLRNGELIARYAKRLLPTYDVFDEARYFQPGTEPCVVECQGRRVAITICEDIWHDSAYRMTGPNYAVDPLGNHPPFDLLVNLSASPFTVGKQGQRREMLGGIANRCGTPVCYVNTVGGNDELIFDGRSLHILPGAYIGSEAAAFAEDVLVVDAYQGGRGAQPLPSPEEETWRALVLGTRDYCLKTKQESVVLGLSGGIDSSLTAAIAVDALGSDHVLGLLMPSPFSTQHSLVDAYALAKNLSMQTDTLHIEPIMTSFASTLANLFANRPPDVTEENLQARIRGVLLMSYANKLGRLLLTTGNKSELSVGYCTIYGDMCGALAVIGDLYKTEVHRMSQWINSKCALCIPEHVLNKPPSAELRPGQVDQESLPPYFELDMILRGLLEERLGVQELAAKGLNAQTVEKVAHLVAMAEFKRRQAAPVLKITRQAFGVGWRMPIACRQAYAPAQPNA